MNFKKAIDKLKEELIDPLVLFDPDINVYYGLVDETDEELMFPLLIVDWQYFVESNQLSEIKFNITHYNHSSEYENDSFTLEELLKLINNSEYVLEDVTKIEDEILETPANGWRVYLG